MENLSEENIFIVEGNKRFYFRKAYTEDAEIIFNLSSDEVVRSNSINQNKIVWDDHVKWFSNKINSSNCLFLLCFSEQNEFIAQVRFDVDEEAEISISITNDFRGKGYSSIILIKAAEIFFNLFTNCYFINATIIKGNEASLSSFIKAGYVFSHEKTINNHSCFVFKRTRTNEI